MRPHQHGQQQTQSLQNAAARIAFPDWQPEPGDWVSLYTGHDHGCRYTEVAVYRGRERIHYLRIAGDDLEPFWRRIMSAHTGT